MKKILLIFSLILAVTQGYSQTFKPVKIDSLVTVSLPQVFVKKDTIGQQTFSANTQFGYIVVTRIPNATNNSPLKKLKDLKKVFKDYENDVAQVGSGTIIAERDTTVGRLKGRAFTLRTDDGSGNTQSRMFLLLYTQEVTYTFQYFYEDVRSYYIAAEVKAFYSSIKLSPELQRNDQYLSTQNGSGLFSTAKIALYGGGLLVIVVLVVMALRRKKKNDDEDITD